MAKSTEKRPRARRKCKERRSQPRVTKSPGLDLDIPSGIEVTPIELLGIMLRVVLKDRITKEEIDTICSVYYKTVKEWWG